MRAWWRDEEFPDDDRLFNATGRRVDAMLAAFKTRMAAPGGDVEQEALRRQELAARERERQLEQRRRDYRVAGLTPPPTKYGVLISLPMMLKQGWRVAEVNGERVLVPPASTEESA